MSRWTLGLLALIIVSACGDDDAASPSAVTSTVSPSTTELRDVTVPANITDPTGEVKDVTVPDLDDVTMPEIADVTFPDSDVTGAVVPLMFTEPCPEVGRGGTDQNGTALECLEGLVWGVRPEPLPRDTSIALAECAEALRRTIEATALGSGSDRSACDEAETLLTVDGTGFAATVRDQVNSCNLDAAYTEAQLAMNGTLAPGTGEDAVQRLFDCSETLTDLVS